jgi:hypothetical protein
MQANIKDSSLLKVALDAFALYIVFHFFYLTSLERCHMLCNSPVVGLENASCSRVWIWLEVATFEGFSALLNLQWDGHVLGFVRRTVASSGARACLTSF